jgi:threonine/homoserine/homoserine lactone efflux protein
MTVGIAYLVFLGAMCSRSEPLVLTKGETPKCDDRTIPEPASMSDVVNPKVLMVLFTLIPRFVNPTFCTSDAADPAVGRHCQHDCIAD